MVDPQIPMDVKMAAALTRLKERKRKEKEKEKETAKNVRTEEIRC
jgi:hypothetical protein